LYGSAAYAAAALARGDQIQRMVNLDMVGYNPGGLNQVRLYDGDNDDEHLMPELLSVFNVAGYGGPVTAIDAGTTNRSDHYPFDARGYDAALIIESAWGSNPYYHQSTDAVETGHIDYAFATHVTSAVAGYLAGAAGLQYATSLVTATVNGSQLVLDWGDNANGTSAVTVRATDGAGQWVEDSFAITVNPVNDAPVVAEPLDDVSVDMNSPDTVISLLDSFADPDLVSSGDRLTYSVTDNTNLGLVSATIHRTDLVLAFTPNESGAADITVRATDVAGSFVEDTVHVTVGETPVFILIRDDGGTGFSTVGSWTAYPNQGYQADIHYAAAGSGESVATWSFGDLTPGIYRVSATWFAWHNRATNSPFTVFDGTTALATVRVNQELAPSDFTESGVGWKDLGGSYQVTGSSLAVALGNDANDHVIADAIRIERIGDLPSGPEIQVLVGAVNVPDGTGSVDYGATAPGIPVVRTFTVRNVGTENLTLAEFITVPTGFSVVSSFADTIVAAGQSTMFTVQLDASAIGSFGGHISFANDDSDENPFDFAVSGAVVVSQILDNGNAGFSSVGSWTAYPNQGYQADIHYAAAGSGESVATWSFGDLTPGIYRVSATWFPWHNRATNSPFTVFDGTTALATVPVNQELAPSDFTESGVGWKDLGGSYQVTGSSLAVALRNDANDHVIADAIRIERIGDLPSGPEIQVLVGAVNLPDGTGSVDYGATAPGMPVVRTFTVRNVGTEDLTLAEFITVPTGFSVVSSFADTIVAAGQSTMFTVQLDASAVGSFGGHISFGNDDSDENPFDFAVSGSVVVIQILDNGNAGFSTVGSWTAYPNQGYQADIHYAAAGSGESVATWSFGDLTPGIYRVSATWFPWHNRATNSPFTVFDGTTALATVRVNQELAPSDFTESGVGWKDLGGSYQVMGNSLVVRLSNNANQYVIADAIRIERLDDLMEEVAGSTYNSPNDGAAGIATGTTASSTDQSQALRVATDAAMANYPGELAAWQFARYLMTDGPDRGDGFESSVGRAADYELLEEILAVVLPQ
jgi:hypothetical protein